MIRPVRFWFASLFLLVISLTARDQPNVVFILADDLGWSDTTLYGQTSLYQTPHLERLASRGMTFDRAYTANPLCSPTRSSILTGLHPARTGLTTPNCHTPQVTLQASARESAASDRRLTSLQPVTRLDPRYETIAERLKAEGYRTGHFGKWHLGAEPYSPFEHGFDVDIPHWHGPGPAGSFVAPWKFKTFQEAYPKEHIEDRMGDEAVKFMETHKNEPFFLNYWQFSVHAPFDAKADLIKKHRSRIDPNDEQRSPTYAAMVESLDDNVGKVLEAIDRLDLTDNTIIVFFSDNGGNMYNEVDGTTPTSNRPLRGGKGNNWDGGVRVPMVVVWPDRVKPGSRCNELVTSTDFFPTLLEMCDLKPGADQEFDGISIVPALLGKPVKRDAIFTFFPHSTRVPDTLPPSTAVYEGDWKLIRLFHNGQDGAHELRLFNLANDIGETRDIAAEYPERTREMDARLDEFLNETGAVLPRLNPNWDPASSELTKLGWKAGKDCSLELEDDHLKVISTGKDPHLSIRFQKPIPGGDFLIRIRLRSTVGGPFEVRWAELGARVPYHSDRLVRSKPFKLNTWQDLEIPFAAANSVRSIRFDPARVPGKILIESCQITRNGKTENQWNFAGGPSRLEK